MPGVTRSRRRRSSPGAGVPIPRRGRWHDAAGPHGLSQHSKDAHVATTQQRLRADAPAPHRPRRLGGSAPPSRPARRFPPPAAPSAPSPRRSPSRSPASPSPAPTRPPAPPRPRRRGRAVAAVTGSHVHRRRHRLHHALHRRTTASTPVTFSIGDTRQDRLPDRRRLDLRPATSGYGPAHVGRALHGRPGARSRSRPSRGPDADGHPAMTSRPTCASRRARSTRCG